MECLETREMEKRGWRSWMLASKRRCLETFTTVYKDLDHNYGYSTIEISVYIIHNLG